MKKILISVLIILLLILCYFSLANGINFLKIKSINNIKSASNKLDNSFKEANELSNKTYPAEVEGLEEAIKQLKIAKQEYENKSVYSTEENPIGTIEIKTYKIHYLWTILGNYKEDRDLESLTLDLKSTANKDVYDLEFTLIGSYAGITEYLYDIENDEELNFEIKNFNLSAALISTEEEDENKENAEKNETNNNKNTEKEEKDTETKNTVTKIDGVTLQAKFTVENIGITLD